MISEQKILDVQHHILSWYQENKRDLPWRKTTDPYKILISEVMLQQTQVDRVIPYFERWLKSFPNFKKLAQAEQKEVLEHWQGLGYNNRGLRLKKLAQEVVENHGGNLPDDESDLLKLPGIGPYTARAVLAFAHNKEVPVVDTNIRRVLIHELNLDENISQEQLENIALQMVPKDNSCTWHNALMDYGATVLTVKKTGIKPLSKQSKFEGSTRQLRGKILKLLLKEKSRAKDQLKKEHPHKDFDKVINSLERDGIILIRDQNIELK